MITGDWYFVDSNTGKDSAGSSGKNMTSPFATWEYAYDQCSAGDGVCLLPWHAETITTQIDLDTIGVTSWGMMHGRTMPTITGNGAIDAVDVSAEGNMIGNIKFAAPLTDAQTADINVDAANCTIYNTMHLGSVGTENKVDIIVLTANADDVLIDGVRIYNTVVECPSAIKIEGALTNGEIRNCFVWDSIGWTNGAIYDAAIGTGLYIHHNVFKNAKAATVVMNFVANSTGICSFNHISGRHTTLASNVVTGTGMDFFEHFGTEEASVTGIPNPVVEVD